MTTAIALIVALNVVGVGLNVGAMLWRERRMRKLRRELDDLAPLIGFVAALADDRAGGVPTKIRELAQDVLPGWADPRPTAVRTLGGRIH